MHWGEQQQWGSEEDRNVRQMSLQGDRMRLSGAFAGQRLKTTKVITVLQGDTKVTRNVLFVKRISLYSSFDTATDGQGGSIDPQAKSNRSQRSFWKRTHGLEF